MKARLTTHLSGQTDRCIGDTVEGAEALSLCAAGFAVPILEKRETATKAVSTETRKND